MSTKPNFSRMLKAELSGLAEGLWDNIEDLRSKNEALTEKVESLNDERVEILNELADLQDAAPDKPKLGLVESINLTGVFELVEFLDAEMQLRKGQRGLMQPSAHERKLEAIVAKAKACLNEITGED